MKRAKFQITFSEAEKVNPLFTKCKIYVLYPDLNRNNSFISKESIEDAIPSIFNTPIIGEYIKESDNFGSHGGKIEVSDEGIRFVDTTKPYGVVPESANIYWEDVTEEDGTVNEYLVVEDAYLWTGRYEEVSNLLENSFGQSMEIEILDSEWIKEGKTKVFNIKKFIFSALCILGIAKEDDENGHVEPCFESASIMAYSLDKDEFKKQFNQMIKELKFSLASTQKENNNSIESKHVSDFDAEGGKEMPEENKDPEIKQPEVFALSHEQIESELRRELSQFKTVDNWGYSYSHYYLIDFLPDQNIAIAYDCEEGYMVGVDFSVNGDVVALDIETKKRYKVEYVPMSTDTEPNEDFSLIPKEYVEYQLNVKEKEVESKLKTEYDTKIENYENDLNSIKEEFEVIKQEKEELANFKSNKLQEERDAEETAIFEKFSEELTEDEMKSVKDDASKYSLEEIEDKLFALAGRKKVKFSAIKKKERISIGAFGLNDDDSNTQKDIWAEKKEELSPNK